MKRQLKQQVTVGNKKVLKRENVKDSTKHGSFLTSPSSCTVRPPSTRGKIGIPSNEMKSSRFV